MEAIYRIFKNVFISLCILILFISILFQLNNYFAEKIFYDNFSITEINENEEDEIILLDSYDYSSVLGGAAPEELDLFRYYKKIVPSNEQKYFSYIETFAFVSGIDADALATPISAITNNQIAEFKLDGNYLNNEVPDAIKLLVDRRFKSFYKLGEKYQIIMFDQNGDFVDVAFFVSGYIDNEQLQPTTTVDKLQGNWNMYFTAIFDNEEQLKNFMTDYSYTDSDVITKYQIHLPKKYKNLFYEKRFETRIYVNNILQEIKLNNSMIKEKKQNYYTRLLLYGITVLLSFGIFLLSELDTYKTLFSVKFVCGAMKKRIAYELMQQGIILASIAAIIMFGYFKLNGIYFYTIVPILDRDYFSIKIYFQSLCCIGLLFLSVYLFMYINVKLKFSDWKVEE